MNLDALNFFTIDENCKEFENTDSTKKEKSVDESSGAKSFSESDESEKLMNNPIFEFKVLGKNDHVNTCKFPEDINVLHT